MTVNAQTLTRDEAQIRSALNSFSAMADQGAYEYLGRLFSPELTVDYTSLFGGEPQKVSRQDLMKQWAGFLPGFDTTYHELSNMQVVVNGSSVSAKVDITASHWLGDDGFWAVTGEYAFLMAKVEGHWHITSVTLKANSEDGSRDILAQAPRFAEQKLKAKEARKNSFE
ncbi:nuclear transport factor 2 family protein [Photobacterium sanctipauli]|nr:nuclear transport factor 2 family protein [Photobacterium sanctipauli]